MLNLEGALPHFLDMHEKNTFTGKLTRKKKIYVLHVHPPTSSHNGLGF